jgi:hypothetical protein
MPKKCPPGVFCIENLTLVFLLIAVIIAGLVVINYYKPQTKKSTRPEIVTVHHQHPPAQMGGISTRRDPLSDPYAPPLKKSGYIHDTDSGDIRGIPVNIETRGLNMDYQQVGILTKQGGMNENLILPLMGRRLMSGRDKWQYYTISNTGFVNTKLPLSVNGKSCSGEYGCDEIHNGSNVYAEGYNDTFLATIYENGTFQYIPYL